MRASSLVLAWLGAGLLWPWTTRAHEPQLSPPAVIDAPPVARPQSDRHQEVRVVVRVTLSASGDVERAELDPSAPAPSPFAEAALEYVRSVKFAPARDGERAIAAAIRYEVLFPIVAASDGAVVDGEPAQHVHAHTHTIVHSHEHAEDERHDHDFGASARVPRPERSASSYTLDRKDLPRGAHVLARDLAQSVPGMFVVQHAGGGKANQYFLRGFDADHGTDIALTVDGVPVNMVSHGHGQGYADLNWVIPELIATVDVRKGTYDPRYGDFATAGAIDFQTGSQLPPSQVKLEAGMFHSYRGLALVGSKWGALRLTGAAELFGTDGPFKRPEDLQRVNLFARAASRVGAGELALTLTGYVSGWNASGQIPEREVRCRAARPLWVHRSPRGWAIHAPQPLSALPERQRALSALGRTRLRQPVQLLALLELHVLSRRPDPRRHDPSARRPLARWLQGPLRA